MNQIPSRSQTKENNFPFFTLLTFNVKKTKLNHEIYVNRIMKSPDKADPPQLVLLLADQPLLVIMNQRPLWGYNYFA